MPRCHSNSNKLHQQQEAAAITLQKATLQAVTAEHQKLLELKQPYLKKQHHQLCHEPCPKAGITNGYLLT